MIRAMSDVLTPAAARSTPKRAAKRKPVKRTPPDPAKAWAKRLARTRPGLVPFVMDALAERYGTPVWARVHDPTSELVLTILSQNSADVNAEQAFEGLRTRFPGSPVPGSPAPTSQGDRRVNRPGWGGIGLQAAAAEPDWAAVEQAPVEELVDAIRSGGLAQQKAPRIQASLRTIREQRGDYSLEFLGDMAALDARDWLTTIDGVGRKTASVVLLFSFGTPLMPVDRHVERVSKRIGLMPPKATADEGHEQWLAMLEPDQMYAAHVGVICHGRQTCHARNPRCDVCPIAPRCRYIDRRAP
jgi:endonuclease III